MLTWLLVVVAPALSVARAVRTWGPCGTFFQVKEYGAVVSWPRTVERSRNSTFVTLPPGSLAVAVTVIVGFQAKDAPSAGEVIAALGGVLPALLTVIVAGALVVLAPNSSVARAVTAYVPAATPLQLKLYGAVVSSPSFVVPLKNSTFVTVPSGSDAVAARLTVAGAGDVALFAGCVSETGGAPWVGIIRATDGTPFASRMKSM